MRRNWFSKSSIHNVNYNAVHLFCNIYMIFNLIISVVTTLVCNQTFCNNIFNVSKYQSIHEYNSYTIYIQYITFERTDVFQNITVHQMFTIFKQRKHLYHFNHVMINWNIVQTLISILSLMTK